MKIFSEAIARAYAIGYFDGRTSGIEATPEHFNDAQRQAYRWGYDAGISDFCHEAEESIK